MTSIRSNRGQFIRSLPSCGIPAVLYNFWLLNNTYIQSWNGQEGRTGDPLYFSTENDGSCDPIGYEMFDTGLYKFKTDFGCGLSVDLIGLRNDASMFDHPQNTPLRFLWCFWDGRGIPRVHPEAIRAIQTATSVIDAETIRSTHGRKWIEKAEFGACILHATGTFKKKN